MSVNWGSLRTAFAILGAYTVWRVVYAIFLSPLRRVPGPFIAKITGKWILFIELAGKRATTVHALHKRYGPVVCIGPNELSFNAIGPVETIYASQSSQFRKAPWYSNITRGGVFNTQEPTEHRRRKKQLNHAFSQQSVNDMEPCIRQQVEKLLTTIGIRREKSSVDVWHWFRMLVLDISGDVFFGKPFGGLDCDETPQYVTDMDSAFIVWDLRGRFPMLMWIVRRLPIKKLQHFFQADDRLYQYGVKTFEDYLRRYGRTTQRKDLLTKLIPKEDGADGLTDDQISSEISNLTFAATDTTGIALTYMLWELAQHPDIQDELRAELRRVPHPDASSIPEHKTLASLPFLHAVIQESMRKHPSIPMGLPRIAPPGGSVMEGYFVPEKTVVSVPIHTIHRNPTHFPSPETFSPRRWLTTPSSHEGTEEMKKLSMAFSKGARRCIGQAMAMSVLRITLASVVLRYNVTVSKDMREDDMDMTDHFALIPKGDRCLLDFVPVAR